MAVTFPTSPVDGDTHAMGVVTYTYNSASNKWNGVSPAIIPALDLSPKTTDPTVRDNGTALAEGDAYYNTTDDVIMTYDGAAWNTVMTSNTDYGITQNNGEIRLADDRRRNNTGTDVYSGNTHDYTFYDASHGIRWYTAGNEEMRLENDGDLHVDGDITAFSTTVSDLRLKENVKPIDNALDKVASIGGYTFNYIKDGYESAGLIAQEVEEVLPTAVKEKQLAFHAPEGSEDAYKVVQYDQVIGLLVEAVKELTSKVEALEEK